VSDLIFAEPRFVHLLWAVLAASVSFVLLERRGGRKLALFVAAPIQSRLVHRPTTLRRWLRVGLLALCGTALVVALMRPQWGVEFITSPRVGAEIMIALDVSKSMLAEDVAPNRLERAKAEIRDLLPYLEGDQVGLIAFAGRASVLSPLTPDFSFLRLVLDNVEVGSVRRGGTRLEEPIRKAVDGFGGSGDLSRVILLITDGEDHDSFPLDAAEYAAERGVHILAIGFGDEDGSPITVTNPRSGARTPLLDSAGRPVHSRLDGDLLRELALTTDGAYIPAGTGVLDLESIFEAHIRPLMRGSGDARGKTVRKEGFQWAILVGLLALIGSAATNAGRATFFGIALLAVVLNSTGATAQAPSPALGAPDEPATSVALDENSGEAESGGRERLDLPEDSREAFNRGLEALQDGRLDDAERLFEAARSGARGDGEARFRATYNQGWVDVERADAELEGDPEAALRSLQRAADWFRESIAVRPANEDARRNLEIVLQRALALEDSLANHEPRDVAQRLDALIEQQRQAASAIRQLVEVVQQSDDPNVADRLRPQFKQLAVEERTILAEAGALTELAGGELDALANRADEELTPEERMRSAQLSGVLHYTHRSRERIGQTRSQLRQRQAGRAALRAAAGLSNLKRAREQLLDPVQVLDGAIRDTTTLAQETRALAAADLGLAFQGGTDEDGERLPEIPAWLDAEYLAQAQAAISERTDELAQKFEFALGQSDAVEDPQQQALMEQIREAHPLIVEAHEHFEQARQQLVSARVPDALGAQSEALGALIDAREQFLDLKRLIEVTYADETRIHAVLNGEEEDDEQVIREYAQVLGLLQHKNIERSDRLGGLLGAKRQELLSTHEQEDAAGGSDESGREAREKELEQLDLADGLLALIDSAMASATESLAALGASGSALEESRAHVASAQRGLEALRRLFFSVVEHIQDAAQQQIELSDRTDESSALEGDRQADALGPLSTRQAELAERSEQIADALHQQSFADPSELLGPEAAADEAAAQDATRRLTEASELVLLASEAMKVAGEELAFEAPGFESIRAQQITAVEKLVEALAVLQPPQEQQDPGQQDQQQEQEEQQQQPQPQPDEQQPEEQPTGDPSQLLQSVRDREAERHRRRSEQTQRSNDQVDKDW